MRQLLLLLVCFSLVGCAAVDAVTELFGGAEDNSEPPAPLTEYAPEIVITELWDEKVGDGSDGQILKLAPTIAAGKIFVASNDGLVQARNLANGDLYWEAETELPFSAGPGVAGGLAVVGTSKGQVAAFNSETGSQLWTATVTSEVLSVPVIANDRVIIRCTDGTVSALNAKTGVRLWSYETSVPPLSMRGTSTPVVVEGQVIGGYDNGKLLALRLDDGKFVWEANVAIPKGRSEVERLVDIDADLVVAGGVIYVAAHNGGISAVSELDGDVLWRNDSLSSHSGLSQDWQYLYLSDSVSDVWQLDQRGGSSLWKQRELHQRRLSAPTIYESYVVVGDFEGYLHWLSTTDGRLMGRVQVTDASIEAKPVVSGDVVYVYAGDGTLAAYRVGIQ